ncbi:hypothetical protein CK203_026610 [Vitis vinifera]|uniref:Uncharacterized protein n=1 Tax=Vitis vinifera TaxID=29760 RepID=A0A438ITQ8_VITVI|nr:hypothetical protein CK203_026610 [Vitis vinifera]
MTKYGMTTKKDSSTLEVTSTQEAPIPSNNGGSDDAALLITKHKLNGAVPRPMKEDRKFKGRKVENNMVMS